MDDWRLCARCGLVPGRPREDDPDTYLCDACRRHVEQLGDAAAELTHVLMRWGREQEWRGVDHDVLLEALGLGFGLFEARLLGGASLAGTPQLLGAAVVDDALELVLSSGPAAVWREAFGSFDSRHPRVPFLAVTETGGGPVDVTLHYWDKRERAAMTLGFWAAEEQVLEEFSRAADARRWGVPWSVVEVGGLEEGSAGAVEYLCDIVGRLGFFPATGSRDAATGTATVELAGDMNDGARALLVETITRSLACDPASVEVRPATLGSGAG